MDVLGCLRNEIFRPMIEERAINETANQTFGMFEDVVGMGL